MKITPLLITTSHRPTRRVRTLSHDLQRVLPGSLRINRGKLSFDEVVQEALTLGADRLIFLERWKGAPGKIELYVLRPNVGRYFPMIYLASVRIQDELYGHAPVRGRLIATVPEEAKPELRRFGEALTNFLQIPLATREQDTTGSAASMVFDDTERSETVVTFTRLPSGAEIGPRLIVKNLIWSDRR